MEYLGDVVNSWLSGTSQLQKNPKNKKPMVVAGTSGSSRGVTVWPQELWQGTHSMAGSEGGLAGSRHPGESALALGWRREKGEAGQQLNLKEVWVPFWGPLARNEGKTEIF